MTSFKKPAFGFSESVAAFFNSSVEHWRLPNILKLSLKAGPELGYEVARVRSQMNQVILSKRLPERNEDGSVNWSNMFAVEMELGQPISREAIFPNGTKGMTDQEILTQAHEFLSQYSVRWNFGNVTTAMDPNVLPEVIDEDIREVAMKINQLSFTRTGSSCSGHAEGSGGFSHSNMRFTYDALHDDHPSFLEMIKNHCEDFNQKEGISASFIDFGSEDGFGAVGTQLSISAPDDWTENELPEGTKTPKENRSALLPDFYTTDGYISRDFDFDDPENQRLDRLVDKYNVEYYRRKNSFNHSDRCRQLRDQFWEGICEIVDSFK